MRDLNSLGRGDSWAGVRAVVVGFDADGQSAADNLLHLGADVTVIDPEPKPETEEFAALLSVLGADIRREGIGDIRGDLLVVSGTAATAEALRQVRTTLPEIPVLSALDLARQLEPSQTWMLVGAPDGPSDGPSDGAAQAHRIAHATAAMLRAGGVRAAAGGVERSVMELVMEPEPYEVLVIAVTAGTLAVSGALRPHSACVLRGDAGLGAVFTDAELACVYRLEDPATEDMVREADVIEGARAIGITRGTPGLSMLGVVEDVLCDRAFVENRQTSAAEICTLGELADPSAASVEAVLAAVALARAYGVALAPIRLCISETF